MPSLWASSFGLIARPAGQPPRSKMARMNELRCEMDRPALLRTAVEPFYSFSPLDALWLY
ncbi:hypothetical protein PCANC_06136 [Puccinia coronata f. sp. avenae]|uniref:Uncharacterized protein n=1 Tax=Puccinia coronata f. sp. avenae TaxID=200324 RepID=A0A2N5SRZ2_9BASI|nr:hypothetical protein PCASD_19282 [Puccinia coronata f. sp. avenae]PLW46574.1 hypothetical protein PCASD_07380 [Puccinia coronata f. sp. avenae]PLW53384.1 hypothetical protein PCANC_06136 [Puccinia coronata f. sp. avenae]